jgi:hypothetical protein
LEVGLDPSFDRATYVRRVVRPLRGRPGALPGSRLEMYAVEPGMSPAAVAARIAAVRACWIDLRDRGGHLGSVAETLLAADERAGVGADLLDAGSWADHEPQTPPTGERTVPTPLPVLPTAAAREVTVTPHGTGVRVAWTSGDPGARHYVVRAVGRLPTALDDGDVVARPGPAESGEAVDPAPPVGATLGYAVIALADGGTPASAVGARIRVVPPVADVVVAGGAGEVTARWTHHPDMVEVDVRRRGADGDVPVAADRGAFRDAPPGGIEHEYVLVARYAGGLSAEPAVVRGATRPEPVPVTDLFAGPRPADEGPGVLLGWRQAVGAQVQIRRSATPCPWPFGATVADAEVAALGEPLDGERVTAAGRTTLAAPVPPGPWFLTAFTRTGDGWLRGNDVRIDVVPPVTGLRAHRQGREVLLSWVWPDGITLADVHTGGPVQRVLRQRYVGDGGVRFDCGPTATRIQVIAIRRDDTGAEAAALAVSTTVPAVRTPVRWTVIRSGHRWRGNERIAVEVTAEADLYCTVALTATPGIVLPIEHRPDAELFRGEVALVTGRPTVVADLPLPPLPRPYWLRLFVLDPPGARAADPPVDRMKVT